MHIMLTTIRKRLGRPTCEQGHRRIAYRPHQDIFPTIFYFGKPHDTCSASSTYHYVERVDFLSRFHLERCYLVGLEGNKYTWVKEQLASSKLVESIQINNKNNSSLVNTQSQNFLRPIVINTGSWDSRTTTQITSELLVLFSMFIWRANIARQWHP